jgi:hypothetical protein
MSLTITQLENPVEKFAPAQNLGDVTSAQAPWIGQVALKNSL